MTKRLIIDDDPQKTVSALKPLNTARSTIEIIAMNVNQVAKTIIQKEKPDLSLQGITGKSRAGKLGSIVLIAV